MTPAIRLLKKRKIEYTLHPYEHHTDERNFGEEAAEALNVDRGRIFKTLCVQLNEDAKNLGVAIVPVSGQLDLKAFARVLDCKKAKMAEIRIAENMTGYIQGGISPLAQKKLLPTVIDESAIDFPSVFVSGGKRGLQIELNPLDLKQLLNAKSAHIAK